jgi:hypothetical protein
MLDFVKQLFENNVISEQVRSEIESAWQQRIQENREQVTRDLREEFAQKYEHDKSQIVNAVESMLSERLAAELTEFAEDRNGLIEARARYAKKMKADAKTMEAFVLHTLKKELAELHEDRKSIAKNVAKIESFIVDSLAKEIAEFHLDKKDLAETKVRLVKESKVKFNTVKKQFIQQAASKINETVSNGIRNEMLQLKEDINAARKNDFGRRIFESFASEYAASYLNEKSETAKLLKIVKAREVELEHAVQAATQAEKMVESKQSEIRKLRELAERKEILSELLSPLKEEKRIVMRELLESVQTPRLRSAYEKYLPAVLDRGKPARRALTEGTEVTGNRKAKTGNDDKVAEIYDIRRLAGL